MRILVALLLVATLFSCGEKNQFVLNGHIKGVKSDQIVLGTYDRSKGVFLGIDTADVVDGRFTFEKPSLEVENYTLQLLDAKISLGALLENGNITLEADRKDAQRGYIQNVSLKGAKNQALIEKFHGMKDEILKQEKYAECKELAGKLKSVKDRYEYLEINEKINKLAPNLEDEVKAAQLDMLEKNVNQFFVVQVFPFIQRIASGEQIKSLHAKLPASLKQHDNVDKVMKDIAIKESIQPGKVAPDFTLKTPEGKDLSLTDLRGQIVLVDFWASWCKPCRASFPHMKDLYKKYHKKGFEILGITNDTNHKAWKKAIKDDGIPWLNVADEFPIKHSPAKVISEYGMDYLPSTVLIDKEGVIIAKLLHGDELDHKLEEIFGF
jgi:peroxiredoxin